MVGIKHRVCEFDINAGRIITMLRTRMGISQQDLGKKLGVTFQQIQKYESGKSRLNAARCISFSRLNRHAVGNLFLHVFIFAVI